MNQEQNVFNNQSSNYNNGTHLGKKKRSKLWLILLIIVVLIGVLIFVFLKKDLFKSSPDDFEQTNNIKEGTIELVFSSSSEISNYTEAANSSIITPYFTHNNNVINIENEVVFTNQDYLCDRYLGDGYFKKCPDSSGLQNDKITIIKENTEIYNNSGSFGKIAYNNNIIYYQIYTDKGEYVVAYDLKNNKELWRTAGFNLYYENGFIRMSSNDFTRVDDDRNYESTKIVDLNGKTIDESTADYQVYPTASKYYIRTKENDYVEVYDFNGKISSISLKPVDGVTYELSEVLDNGMYVITEKSIDNSTVSRLYDINSNQLKEFKDMTIVKNSGLSVTVLECTNIDNSFSNLVLNETKIVEEIKGAYVDIYGQKYKYIVKNNYSSDDYSNTIINIENNKSQTFNTIDEVRVYTNYIILSDRTSYYVYDKELNKKYESTNFLRFVNDDYILDFNSSGENEINLVNINTGDKKLLEVTGKYHSNNSAGVVTFDGTKYYLYKFK